MIWIPRPKTKKRKGDKFHAYQKRDFPGHRHAGGPFEAIIVKKNAKKKVFTVEAEATSGFICKFEPEDWDFERC